MARLLITLGLLLLLLGLTLALFPKAFSWFGSLPGDVDVRRGNSRLVIPITSMLVVSGGLTLLLNLVAWISKLIR